jgi:hypothetical protein
LSVGSFFRDLSGDVGKKRHQNAIKPKEWLTDPDQHSCRNSVGKNDVCSQVYGGVK